MALFLPDNVLSHIILITTTDNNNNYNNNNNKLHCVSKNAPHHCHNNLVKS